MFGLLASAWPAVVGTVAGATVGGFLGLGGTVYLVRHERRAGASGELRAALAAFTAAADELSAVLERRPLMAALTGRDPNELASEFFKANARLMLVAPEPLIGLRHELAVCLVDWQNDRGPGGVTRYAEVRQRLADATREALDVG